MDQLSLVLRNGAIVDGSGRPSFMGDIGIAGDRIVQLGRVNSCENAREIDVGGKIVSPGFIELHTHYDAQLCWDRQATPAAEHGVTTVVAGGCSLSLAPMKPELRQKTTDIFYKIEDLHNDFFEAAVPYNWESFGEFLDHLRPGLGVNVAPVVGHSALRLYVMGADAQKRAATPQERERMCAVLRESLEAGGVGMSSCYDHLHDENDHPMPASYADYEERLALARTCAETGREWVQYSIHPTNGKLRCEELSELGRLSRESGASFSALGLFILPGSDLWRRDLEFMEENRADWGKLSMQTLIRPLDQWYRLDKVWNVLNFAPSWAAIMLKPVPERLQAFRAAHQDAAIRKRLHDESETAGISIQISNSRVLSVVSPENRPYMGQRLKDIAEREGRNYTDVLIEIGVRDGLGTSFVVNDFMHADPVEIPKLLMHPSIHVGGSDAGAHIFQMAGEGDSTYMLGQFVRKSGKIRLEDAIKRLTSDLARDLNLKQRGTLAVGNYADITVFDPDTVERGPMLAVDDVPGGGSRFLHHATGIDKTIINGRIALDKGVYTGERAGAFV